MPPQGPPQQHMPQHVPHHVPQQHVVEQHVPTAPKVPPINQQWHISQAPQAPILKQSKPVGQLVGQAADALAGFHIPHAPIQPTKRDSRMALISTSGENLTEEDVAAFLRVLVSDTFAWEVKWHSGFEFKVPFSTKGDLTKMTRFNAEMKKGVTLKFQEFKEEEEYFGHALLVVWMRVMNLPTILKEYVILWALGTLFGVT